MLSRIHIGAWGGRAWRWRVWGETLRGMTEVTSPGEGRERGARWRALAVRHTLYNSANRSRERGEEGERMRVVAFWAGEFGPEAASRERALESDHCKESERFFCLSTGARIVSALSGFYYLSLLRGTAAVAEGVR